MRWSGTRRKPLLAPKKVRELFHKVSSRRERHAAAVAAAKTTATAKAKAKAKAITMAMAMVKTKAMQQADHTAMSTVGHTSSVQPDEKIKGGSIRNARRGIAERRKLEVSF